tara:strand:+ start:4883 stop:5089 length:207 start_codon:yes stop_codon:yes gene_type:complete
MLKCPYCDSTDNVCVSTINRANINGKQRQVNYVWRRRKCSNCGQKFTTHEKTEQEWTKEKYLNLLEKL